MNPEQSDQETFGSTRCSRAERAEFYFDPLCQLAPARQWLGLFPSIAAMNKCLALINKSSEVRIATNKRTGACAGTGPAPFPPLEWPSETRCTEIDGGKNENATETARDRGNVGCSSCLPFIGASCREEGQDPRASLPDPSVGLNRQRVAKCPPR